MEALTADVRDNGLIEPLVVVPGSWGRHQGLCGDCGERVARDATGVLGVHVVDGRACPGWAEPAADDWLLLAGARRLAAARSAGLESVPCVTRFDLRSEQEQVALMMRENVHRRDLTVTEVAEAFEALRLLGWTSARQSQQLKVSKSVIDRRLRLLGLPRAVWRRLDRGLVGLQEVEESMGVTSVLRSDVASLRGGAAAAGGGD